MTFRKTPKDVVATVETPAQAVPEVKKTFGEVLWAGVKDKELDLFGLSGQLVGKYFTYKFSDDKHLYLEAKVSGAVPALEILLGKDYTVGFEDKYTVVKKKGF